MRLLASFAISAALAHAGCLAVSSGKILAGDLAATVPAFQALDPATPLGFTPLAGTERVLSSRELRLLAREHALDLQDQSIPDVCVMRLVEPLSRQAIEETLRGALGIPGARLDVIEFSNQPLPPGRLEFPLSGLNQPPVSRPEDPVIWRGRLTYDGQRSVSLWARVRIAVERTWFVAAENIPAGQLIRAGDIQAISSRTFPFKVSSPDSAGSILGKIARRAIPRSQRVLSNAIQDPPDVAKGDTVRVNVTSGSASIALDAVARADGKKGDVILVHNPSSGRNFRAVIEDKGQVAVLSPSGT
ncbi:MAG: flagellar basal body P-ring formation chaperone FlgA [Acidobacteriia bacterium]|nr:flagellar basal body P-ring formation chaperone FlgA [Terriglobia bacterium]